MILNLKMWPTEVRVQKSDILGATHWKERVSSENSFSENIQASSFLSGIGTWSIFHPQDNRPTKLLPLLFRKLGA